MSRFNWRQATLAQLVIIRYHDSVATKADKKKAYNEIKFRQKLRSGKPAKVSGRSVIRK